MAILWFLLIGLAAGWLAGRLMRGASFGLVGDLVVGVVGALIGGILFRWAGLSRAHNMLGSLLVATVGAVVLLFLLRMLKRA